jgi:hypothetical protein
VRIFHARVIRARKFLAVTNHSVALYYLHEHS